MDIADILDPDALEHFVRLADRSGHQVKMARVKDRLYAGTSELFENGLQVSFCVEHKWRFNFKSGQQI